MSKRRSRYILAGKSFSEIARMPIGSKEVIQLNTEEVDAHREVSKSLKAAFSRTDRKCKIVAGTATGEFYFRREAQATHIYVTVLSKHECQKPISRTKKNPVW